jgi:hypothetical protein
MNLWNTFVANLIPRQDKQKFTGLQRQRWEANGTNNQLTLSRISKVRCKRMKRKSRRGRNAREPLEQADPTERLETEITHRKTELVLRQMNYNKAPGSYAVSCLAANHKKDINEAQKMGKMICAAKHKFTQKYLC